MKCYKFLTILRFLWLSYKIFYNRVFLYAFCIVHMQGLSLNVVDELSHLMLDGSNFPLELVESPVQPHMLVWGN